MRACPCCHTYAAQHAAEQATRGVCLGAGGSLGVVAAVWEFKGATYTQAELSVTLLDAEAVVLLHCCLTTHCPIAMDVVHITYDHGGDT